MDWKDALTRNWHFKIAAFALAGLLWVNVTTEEPGEQVLPADVEVQLLDSAWVVTDQPSEVEVEFEGRMRELLQLAGDRPVLRVVVDSVTGPTMNVNLSPDQVSFDRDLRVSPSSIFPGVIALEFEPRITRRVPVQPDIEATASPGHAIVLPYVVQPESVTVEGPESAVPSIREVGVPQVPLEELEHTVTRELPVRLPPGVTNVAASPERVLVTVMVDSIVQERLTLPVRVEGAGADGATAEPQAVEATLHGPPGAVRAAIEELDAAVVRLGAVPEGPVSVAPVVNLPDDAAVTVIFRPPEVTVRPAGGT